MLKDLLAKIIKFIKQNILFFIVLIIINFIITLPVSYSIYAPGGLIDISDRLTIKDEYKTKGSFNLAYVTEIKGNVLTYLLSYIIPSWDLIPESEYLYDDETYAELEYENQVMLDESNQNAVFTAYSKASLEVNIKSYINNVTYVDNDAKTDLKIGDKILECNDIVITNVEDYKKIVNDSKLGDKLILKVKDSNNKIVNRYIKVIEIDKEKLTGIYFITIYKYTTNPKISFAFKDSESGPSGGLMISLSIYSKLISKDLTHGKTIVGTGTIDALGNVGEISGIEYKLKGAVKEGADIFFAPSGDNYKEAVKLQNKYHYNIDIIEVSTFDDALKYLESI